MSKLFCVFWLSWRALLLWLFFVCCCLCLVLTYVLLVFQQKLLIASTRFWFLVSGIWFYNVFLGFWWFHGFPIMAITANIIMNEIITIIVVISILAKINIISVSSESLQIWLALAGCLVVSVFVCLCVYVSLV